MKKSIMTIATAAVCMAACADEWLPFTDRPLSGDRVVLNDATYVLMSVEDFAAFTNKMAFFESVAAKRWEIQHATESGRTQWHGSRVNQKFEKAGAGTMKRITEYADGYRHTEIVKHKTAVPEKKYEKPTDYIKLLRERRAKGGAK